MEFFKKIKYLLNKPFPLIDNWRDYTRSIGVISVFVTLFLYIFQPFGISTIDSSKFLICLGFGSMTFISSIMYEWLNRLTFKHHLKNEKFVFGKWIVKTIGLVLIISLANFLFARLALFGYIRWAFLPDMIYGTFAVAVFPIVIIGIFSLLKEEKKYQTMALKINQEYITQGISKSAHKQLVFGIPVHTIRYIEALQNYIKIYYIDDGLNMLDKIERATLKSIIEETEQDVLVRCHRSYVVNKEQVLEVNGNAQGLLLTISNCEKNIPVSRKYIDLFR